MSARASQRIKQLRGTARADRQKAPGAHERLQCTPEPPPNLSEAAAAEWRALAPLLVEAGTLTPADLRALELLAATLADAASFAAAIERDGLLVTGAAGAKKSHPGLNALGQARAQARALLADFGLTPRSRGGVEVAPQGASGEPDPMDEFRMAGQ